jgi:hypothetical protein
MAVAAAIVAYRQIATAITLVHMAAQISSPAFTKGMQGTFLPAVAAVATEPMPVPVQNISHFILWLHYLSG